MVVNINLSMIFINSYILKKCVICLKPHQHRVFSNQRVIKTTNMRIFIKIILRIKTILHLWISNNTHQTREDTDSNQNNKHKDTHSNKLWNRDIILSQITLIYMKVQTKTILKLQLRIN